MASRSELRALERSGGGLALTAGAAGAGGFAALGGVLSSMGGSFSVGAYSLEGKPVAAGLAATSTFGNIALLKGVSQMGGLSKSSRIIMNTTIRTEAQMINMAAAGSGQRGEVSQ